MKHVEAVPPDALLWDGTEWRQPSCLPVDPFPETTTATLWRNGEWIYKGALRHALKYSRPGDQIQIH